MQIFLNEWNNEKWRYFLNTSVYRAFLQIRYFNWFSWFPFSHAVDWHIVTMVEFNWISVIAYIRST